MFFLVESMANFSGQEREIQGAQLLLQCFLNELLRESFWKSHYTISSSYLQTNTKHQRLNLLTMPPYFLFPFSIYERYSMKKIYFQLQFCIIGKSASKDLQSQAVVGRERDRETNHSVYQRQNQWMFKHQTASNIKNNALLNLIKLDTINYACIGYKQLAL